MLNSFNGLGRLTATPKLKSLDSRSGKLDLVNFNIAIKRNRKNRTGSYDTDFVPCTAWNQSARYLAKYGVKGALCSVAGSFESRTTSDKNDPNKMHYYRGITVNDLNVINTQNHNSSSASNASQSESKSSNILNSSSNSASDKETNSLVDNLPF